MITETGGTARRPEPAGAAAFGSGRGGRCEGGARGDSSPVPPPGLPESGAPGSARRVARNSLVPLGANLIGRATAIVMAVVMARTLGAAGTGLYAVAVNLWLYASIIADFGLGTWLTREVARRPDEARQAVSDALGLRLLLSGLALPALLLAALIAGYVQGGAPDVTLLVTVALLGMGLLPGALSAAGSALFNAHEEMIFPAAVQLAGAALTTAAGATALLLGFDLIALGWVSLATNLLTAAVFVVATRRRFFPLRATLHPARHRRLAREAWPLMLNSLLNNVFFRFDVQVLQSKGSAVVGYYTNAYKVIDAAGAVPSSFILALFPLLSRRAAEEAPTRTSPPEGRRTDEVSGAQTPMAGGGDGLGRVYRLALKLLLVVAWPAAVLVTFLAQDLVRLAFGADFLPHAAVALRLLIWFLPLSCLNGLTQYVLIALGRQQWITLAFTVAAVFNVVANVALIPRYSYVAAAGVTIASEVVLLVPFLLALHGRVALLPALGAALHPLPAALGMGLLLWGPTGLAAQPPLVAAPAALAVYLALLAGTMVFDRTERRVLISLLPIPSRRG